MENSEVSGLVVFPIFALLNCIFAVCCWIVIRRYWKNLNNNRLSHQNKVLTNLRIAIMIPPFLAFIFGFVFFVFQTLTVLFK